MRNKKFSHMKGGKMMATALISAVAFIVIMSVYIFIEKDVPIIPGLILVVAIIFLIAFTRRFCKPAFTDITFSDDSIVSKTLFQKMELPMKEIKGIWYYKLSDYEDETTMRSYSGKDTLKKGCIIVIGDINCFVDVEYIGVNGANILRDTFKKGYTTIRYRKELDEVLEYYYRKIQSRPKTA